MKRVLKQLQVRGWRLGKVTEMLSKRRMRKVSSSMTFCFRVLITMIVHIFIFCQQQSLLVMLPLMLRQRSQNRSFRLKIAKKNIKMTTLFHLMTSLGTSLMIYEIYFKYWFKICLNTTVKRNVSKYINVATLHKGL